MKTLFIITIVLLHFETKPATQQGPGGDIPQPVTAAFSGQFPNDRLKDWETEVNNSILLDADHNSALTEEYLLRFSTSGNLIEKKRKY
jgi:hypothetical protein